MRESHFIKFFYVMPLASSERNFSDFNLLLTRVIIFLVKCLSCYTCTSEDSLQNCNLKSTKKDCPSGTPNCVTGTLICSAGEVTKTVFYKRCGTKGEDCDPSDYPSCPSSQGGWSFGTSGKCCTGDNCNSGPRNTINGAPYRNVYFAGLLGVLLLLNTSYRN